MYVSFFKVVLYLCTIQLLQHHPDIFCFHVGTRHPISSRPLSADAGQVATEIGSPSPDPSKSRRPGSRRAFTRRTRFQAAIVVAEEANETSSICWQFFVDRNIGYVKDWIQLLLGSLHSPPTRHTKRENRDHFGGKTSDPCLHLARRREIYGAQQTCIAASVYCSSCCCCAAATAAAADASAAVTAERIRSKQRRFETGRVAAHISTNKTQLAKMSIEPKFVELTS